MFPHFSRSIFDRARRVLKPDAKRLETLRPKPEKPLDPVPSSKSLISGVRIANVDIKLKLDSTPKRDIGAETQNAGQWRRTIDRYVMWLSDGVTGSSRSHRPISLAFSRPAPLLPSSMTVYVYYPPVAECVAAQEKNSPRRKDASS